MTSFFMLAAAYNLYIKKIIQKRLTTTMTNRDIFNYVSFKEELEHLINRYIQKELPATIILPVIIEAYNSVNASSREEIKTAIAEVEAETQQNDCDECKVETE